MKKEKTPMSVSDYARLMCCSPQNIYKKIKSNKVDFTKTSKGYIVLVDLDDV